MTLHEAIIKVLNQLGQPAQSSKIADLINQQNLYRRGDREPVAASQVSARMNNYRGIFYREENDDIGLVQWKTMPNTFKSPIVKQVVQPDLPQDTQNTEEWDVRNISGLKTANFKSIGRLGFLMKQGLPMDPALKQCGLYSISIPSRYRPGYIDKEKAKANGNVIRPWSTEKLKVKWVKDVDIVYYGLAGKKSQRSLRSRLNDLLKHGNGKITDGGPHQGGEILWQLMDYEEFLVWILPTEGPPTPRDMEHRILTEFNTLSGSLPFANRQF